MNSLELKKKAIMSLMSQPQGTERSVEGDNQIVLSDCTGTDSLTSIKLFGKTEDVPVYDESGNVIPKSPDNPYELKSIENPTITVRGINLFDSSALYQKMYDKLVANGSSTTWILDNVERDGRNCIQINHLGFTAGTTWFENGKENTQYTLSFYMWAGNTTGLGIVVNYTDGSNDYNPITTTGEWRKVVITTVANKTVRKIFQSYNGSTSTYIDKDSMMLHEGATELPYEPYREPKTITLSDVTLRGVVVRPSSDVVPVSYISDSKKYMSDELYIEDGRVYHKVQMAEKDYEGQEAHTNANFINRWQNYGAYLIGIGVRTFTTIDSKQYSFGSVGILCSHFQTPNPLKNYYTPPENSYCVVTGGVGGDYANLIFIYVPITLWGEGLTASEIQTKMRTYLSELKPKFIYPIYESNIVITDITDTEVGKALLGIGTHKGTTVIETDGHLSASYLSNTEG